MTSSAVAGSVAENDSVRSLLADVSGDLNASPRRV